MERGPFWRAGLLPESPWEAHPVTIIANLGEPIGESRSKLMADDELATVAALKQARAVFRDRIAAHSGRLIDTAGDSVLAEFRSVVEAVDCAVEVQERLATDNAPVPEHRKMHFRIGINLGDIIEEDDGTIYGDGVNVAARLEGLAAPGGVMISDFARQAVEGKLDVGMADAGEHEVKNIAKPVRATRTTQTRPSGCCATWSGVWSMRNRASRAASWRGWTRSSPSSASACRTNSGARSPAPTSSRTRWRVVVVGDQPATPAPRISTEIGTSPLRRPDHPRRYFADLKWSPGWLQGWL